MLFPERLKYFRLDKGLSEEQLGEIFELSPSTIRLYECGKMEVSMEVLEKLAEFFNISPALLLGSQYPDLPIEEAVESYRLIQELMVSRQDNKISNQANSSPVKPRGANPQTPPSANIKMIPVYSNINIEQSLFSDKNIEFHWPISDSITRLHGNELRNYFYLRVQGNRMEPNICDQDIVLVKKQTRVENNELAVVLSGKEDAWVSRISYVQGQVLMNYDNKTYAAQSYGVYDCRILGKVIWKTGAPKRA